MQENEFDYIKVHFERPNTSGFDFLDLKMPGAFTINAFGFSEDEILDLKEYARDNEPLFWEFKSQIPIKDLKKISGYILQNRARILAAWFDYFNKL